MTVGETYQLYTTYESIAGIKVKVVGTLAYSECSKVSYNMTVLAINERVISVKDEDLESYIDTDTIYYCRATTANSDGSYSEYIVWDSIINGEKTVKLNKSYAYDMTITINDSTAVPITTIISALEKYIASQYGSTISCTISSATSSDDGETEDEDTLEEKLTRAEAVIDSINRLETKLVPAANTIIDSNLSDTLAEIIDQVDTIASNVSIIAKNVG